MKSKKIGRSLIIIGGLMLLAALLLIFYNKYEAKKAYIESQKVLPEIQEEILLNASQKDDKHTNPYEKESYEMTEVNIDGYDYIGYLSIPSLELNLPVMSSWDYPKLRIAPCRQFGSTKSHDIVIAGHNYDRHFGRLSKLEENSEINFTDMDGEISKYKVGIVNVISPYSYDEVKNSEWDIILYTCTYGGKQRVMVGAVKVNN